MQAVQYVTDTNGKPLYVQVPIAQYEKLVADAEELADIAAYKKAKGKQRKTVSFTVFTSVTTELFMRSLTTY